jgi:uncharacterized membrane protein YciS (DUF1049 family)
MGNLWLRIKIWFKVALVAALFIYVIFFTYNNAQEKVQFWYWFHRQPQTNLLFLVLCTFLAGVIAAFLIRTLVRTIHQIQDVQSRSRSNRLDREIAEIKTKAAMLQTRPPGVAEPLAPPAEAGEEH